MTGFRLKSVDWDSVQILHAAHLFYETGYLEELVRWTLHSGYFRGVLYMEENDLLVSGSERDYEVVLRACRAVTPKGYFVEVNETNRPTPLKGSNDAHSEAVVPIYLEVRAKEAIPMTAVAAQGEPLIECRALQWNYALATQPSAHALDALQIGQMRKDGIRFVKDTNYIPECVYLSSYPSLIRKAKEITSAADRLSEVASRYAKSGTGISHLIAAEIAMAIIRAAIIVNWQTQPRAWLQRLAEVLATEYHLIQPLSSLLLSTWGAAQDQIRDALGCIQRYVESQSQLWETLDRIKKAVESLIPLCEELREPTQPFAKPEAEPSHEPVVAISQGTAVKIKRCPQCKALYSVHGGEIDPGFCPNCRSRTK